MKPARVAELAKIYADAIGYSERVEHYFTRAINTAVDLQREIDAKICDAQALEPECPERAKYCAQAIRSQQ